MKTAASLVGLCLLAVALAGHAHGPEASSVKVRLAALPAALDGLQVQVQTTVAPQLVVANPTDTPLTILDQHGRPFVRIQQNGVWADLTAPAWYRTQSAARGVPLPAGVDADARPNWVRVRRDPSWGWFDPRLRTEAVTVSHAVRDAGKPVVLGHWSVPVRWGGSSQTLSGAFRYQPLPAGIMVSRLTSPVRPADGVSVNLAPGTVPALLVENRSNRPLVVRRDDGQPYLRIDRRGSFLNAGEGQQTRWVQVSDVPRYTWTEPRATLAATQVPVALRESGHEAVVSHWRLPVRLGGESLAVAGEVIWHPQKGKDSHHH